jgi:hypothetical protein
MNDKKAAEVLIRLLKKDVLDDAERRAVEAAIGVLTWTALADSRIKKMGDKRLQASVNS